MARAKQKQERKRGKKKRSGVVQSKDAEHSGRPTQHPESSALAVSDLSTTTGGGGSGNDDQAEERALAPDEQSASYNTTTRNDTASPAWMLDKRPANAFDNSTPFGLVEPDLKAYLRSAHVKLQELVASVVDEGRHLEQDEETKTLRNAMLDEIKGKELVLATDADTSLILEDLLHTFGERQMRIFADALSKE